MINPDTAIAFTALTTTITLFVLSIRHATNPRVWHDWHHYR